MKSHHQDIFVLIETVLQVVKDIAPLVLLINK